MIATIMQERNALLHILLYPFITVNNPLVLLFSCSDQDRLGVRRVSSIMASLRRQVNTGQEGKPGLTCLFLRCESFDARYTPVA